MSLTVWKFPLLITDRQSVSMPFGKILTAQFQGDDLMLWALVKTDAPHEIRHLEIYGTGNPIQEIDEWEKRHYLATTQQPGTPLVWHIFELEDRF